MISVVMDSKMTKGERDSMPIRITLEAIEAARIAASYKKMKLNAYASKVLLEAANRDIEEGHSIRVEPARPKRPAK